MSVSKDGFSVRSVPANSSILCEPVVLAELPGWVALEGILSCVEGAFAGL